MAMLFLRSEQEALSSATSSLGVDLAEGARFPRSAPHTRRLLILRKSIAIIYVEFWHHFGIKKFFEKKW
jgi:hypothetical protein